MAGLQMGTAVLVGTANGLRVWRYDLRRTKRIQPAKADIPGPIGVADTNPDHNTVPSHRSWLPFFRQNRQVGIWQNKTSACLSGMGSNKILRRIARTSAYRALSVG
jgi:hypothetical protein